MRSVGPPVGNGTMMRSCFDGKPCAAAIEAAAKKAMQTRLRMRHSGASRVAILCREFRLRRARRRGSRVDDILRANPAPRTADAPPRSIAVNPRELDVIVVGAGIGGLTAAIYLHAIGCKVRVFESASEIRELGVGINVQPQGIKVLDRLGMGRALDECGVRCEELIYFNRHGQEIWREPRGLPAATASRSSRSTAGGCRA